MNKLNRCVFQKPCSSFYSYANNHKRGKNKNIIIHKRLCVFTGYSARLQNQTDYGSSCEIFSDNFMSDNSDYCSRGNCGRPRVKRCLEIDESPGCYAPVCPQKQKICESVTLYPEEIAVLKLVDLEGLSQEDAASILGVSRKTAWRDLHDARYKVADALANGKMIRVSCCPNKGDGICSPLPVNLAEKGK